MHLLRYWMSLVEGKVAYRDHELVVILNPSRAEFERMAAKANHGEGLRAILSFGDLYVWDGYYANHDEVGRKLHISSDAELHLWDSYIELDAIHLRMGHDDDEDEDEDDSELDDARNLANSVRANPCIQRLYGRNAQVQADFGDRQERV